MQETERKLLDGQGTHSGAANQVMPVDGSAGPMQPSNMANVESIIQKYMPPQTQAEKEIIKDITKKLKKTFWNYYKDHKTDMIEE